MWRNTTFFRFLSLKCLTALAVSLILVCLEIRSSSSCGAFYYCPLFSSSAYVQSIAPRRLHFSGFIGWELVVGSRKSQPQGGFVRGSSPCTLDLLWQLKGYLCMAVHCRALTACEYSYPQNHKSPRLGWVCKVDLRCSCSLANGRIQVLYQKHVWKAKPNMIGLHCLPCQWVVYVIRVLLVLFCFLRPEEGVLY